MNTLTYIFQLTDRMSATLKKIGAATDSTTQDVRELKGEVNNLNNVNLGGFFSSIRKLAPAITVGAVLGKSVKSGMEQEMRDTSFEVLFGGVDNAKKMINDISDYAAKSPYGKVGLSEATQMMAGFGIAQEKIMPNLKAIGDIAMGDANKFSSLTLAFSQMSSTGKLTGQDLLQMINAGFNPLEQMSKTTGKSIGYLKEQMGKGLISSQMVTQAFQDATKEGGLYHGMIDKISNTAAGQWATALDNLEEKLLNLYKNVLQPIILPALKKLNAFLSDPIGTIGRFIDRVTTDFPVISSAVIALTASFAAYKLVVGIITLKTKLWAGAQMILNTIMSLNPVGLIIAGVVALIALITLLIVKISGWGAAWKHTVQGVKLVWLSYVEYVKTSFNTVVQSLMIGINKIKEGWYKFKEAVGIGDSSENQRMLAQISADTEARKKSIVDGAKKTVDLAKQAGQEFSKAAGSFSWNKTSFSDVANNLKKKIGISTPGIPGANVPGSETTEGAGLSGGGSGVGNVGASTANSIATGGTKTTHINITIGEMGNNMQIVVDSIKEGAANVRGIVLDELTRALAMAQGQV